MTPCMIEREDDHVRYAVVDGMHVFDTGMDGACVGIDLPLTGRQIQFLMRNPAAVRCCLVKVEFTVAWLDALIEQAAVIDRSGSTAGRVVH